MENISYVWKHFNIFKNQLTHHFFYNSNGKLIYSPIILINYESVDDRSPS